tara:strand:+ start:1041 stop:1475 length:435 start_codon:yes stop_codon:yes gene_type:complete
MAANQSTGVFVKNRRTPSASTSVVIPGGATDERPTAPVFGSFRFNTSIAGLEFFDGTIFKSVGIAGEANLVVDAFVGDAATYTFTLSSTVSDEDQVIVFVSNIYQQPVGVYTITGAGSDITFSAAPLDGEPIHVIHGLGTVPST